MSKIVIGFLIFLAVILVWFLIAWLPPFVKSARVERRLRKEKKKSRPEDEWKY